MSDQFIVSGKRVVYLICVSVGGKTSSSNKFYRMYEIGDGTFLARWGREGNEASSKYYPMSKWDSTIKSKTSRRENPYKNVSDLFSDDRSGNGEDPFNKIKGDDIRSLMLSLNGYAKYSVSANYAISPKSVTKSQIDAAQKIIDEISYEISFGGKDIKTLNKKLIDLYHLIPRKMNDVRRHLCSEDSGDPIGVFVSIIVNEQSTLDTLSGQISLSNIGENSDISILDELGLNIELATANDVDLIKDLMGSSSHHYSKAFRISNTKTQDQFDLNLSKASSKKTKLLWHGSRNENWFNILSNGLLIRPSGAIHTGSMFGDAIYGASVAKKSIGYTSINGSYWSKGKSDKAYLALYNFHIGNQHVIKKHTHECYSIDKNKLELIGKDSVFALKGADLKNDEYMVYDHSQCSIAYLIEIK